MGGQKQYDVFITQRKKAKYAEHQCCSPKCHWHQFPRHRFAKSLGQYLLFWQLESSSKRERNNNNRKKKKTKMKGIIGVTK